MKKVVIIGGGFAGALAARKLEDSFAVTLIDAKDYFEFTPSILRTLIEPGHYKKIEVLHRRYLHQAQVVDEIVESFDSQAVVTKTKKYPYDYLIIATGSRYNLPIKEVIEPIFVQNHEPGAFKPTEPIIEKDAIMAVVKQYC